MTYAALSIGVFVLLILVVAVVVVVWGWFAGVDELRVGFVGVE